MLTPRQLAMAQPYKQEEKVAVIKPEVKPQVVVKAEEPESNPNDDSMCFSKNTSLEEYIIGKQIG